MSPRVTRITRAVHTQPTDVRGRVDSLRAMEASIIFRPTDQDEANLSIIEATGLTREEAIRAALTSLAVDLVPVVRALRERSDQPTVAPVSA